MILQMADEKKPTLVTLEAKNAPAKLSALQIDPVWIVVLAIAAVVGYLAWKEYQRGE